MFKKAVCLVLLVLTLVTYAVPFAAHSADGDQYPFTDVPKWASKAVGRMYQRGYMNGISDTLFGSSNVITRGMFALILAKIADAELGPKNVTTFDDVPANKYYTAAVNWAFENGIISGSGNGKFMPNSPVTREQALVMLRALGDYLDYDVTYEDPTLLILYHDNGKISKYAKRAVAWGVDYGLISGDGDYALNPKKAATRAEMAVILNKFLDYTVTPPIVPPNIYTVTFVNWNGDVLYTDHVAEGKTASYRAESPSRLPEGKYEYVFTGWDKEIKETPVESNITFVAEYKKQTRHLKIQFVNWDGKLLYSTTILYANSVTYSGPAPKRPNDAKYMYSFTGWDKKLGPLYDDTTFYAQYDAIPLDVKVTFVNWDGKTIWSTTVKYGTKPVYKGPTPTKAPDSKYSYVFAGWDREFTPIYDATVYKAQYTKKDRTVKVSFVDWDGRVISSYELKYGATASFTGTAPVREYDGTYEYTFIGWDKAFTALYDDTIYTAQYKAFKKRNIHDDVLSANGIDFNGRNGYVVNPTLWKNLNNVLYDRGERDVGLYVVDLETNMTIGYHAKKQFWAACTVKAPMAMVAYKRAEQGAFSLDNTYWTYLERHYCERSGTIQYSAFGTKYKAREVIHRMINISDNVAYYMCQDYVGYRYFNKQMEELGVHTRHSNFDGWGNFTPQELGFIWQEIYRYQGVSNYGKQLYNEFLNGQSDINFIRRGLYSKYPVAHKSGWREERVFNDAGVVMSDHPYILVILMTDNNYTGNVSYMGKVARAVDAIMTDYANYRASN